MIYCWAADWWTAAAALTAGSVGGFCSGVTGSLHKRGMGILLVSLLWVWFDFHCSNIHHLNVGEERLFLTSAASIGPAQPRWRQHAVAGAAEGRGADVNFDHLICSDEFFFLKQIKQDEMAFQHFSLRSEKSWSS